MRVLVLTNTPAHVHLYRHAVAELRERGHEVLVLARDYGCTVALLEQYGTPFETYGACGTTQRSLFANLPAQYARLLPTAVRFDPDVVFGMGAYAAHAGLVARAPTVLVLDSEPTSLDHAVSKPFARALLTPAAFTKDLGERHHVFEGFKESAYLHPGRFTPDPTVRDELGVGPDERFALVRLNAFGSHHDVGRGGFDDDQRRALLTSLAEEATVLVSDEGGDLDLSGLPARRYDAHPALLHDALAAADLLVADTQTMVTEAALLGTPAVRSNAFVGEADMGNFLALERAGLVRNVAAFEDVLATASGLLADGGAVADWRARRDEYVTDMVDLTGVIVDVAEVRGDPTGVGGLRRRATAGD